MRSLSLGQGWSPTELRSLGHQTRFYEACFSPTAVPTPISFFPDSISIVRWAGAYSRPLYWALILWCVWEQFGCGKSSQAGRRKCATHTGLQDMPYIYTQEMSSRPTYIPCTLVSEGLEHTCVYTCVTAPVFVAHFLDVCVCVCVCVHLHILS